MRHQLWVLLLLIYISPVTITQGWTETTFAPTIDDSPTSYYWGSLKTITVYNQILGVEYSLLVGANQWASERQWINYTATEGTAEITFRQESDPVDTDGNQLEYLALWLYANGTVVDRLVLSIVYPTDQYNAPAIMQSLFYVVAMVLIGGFVIAFMRRR